MKSNRVGRSRPSGSLLRHWSTVALLFLAVGGLGACAVNPATGERQLSLIGREREIEMGRDADESVVQSMGLYDNEGLQAYVAQIGRAMAAESERPDLPWTFRVVDDPVINAFALPGGFIYVTRGILAHFDSEAQLAAVLGHEIGHVTARHSVNQMSRQQLAGLGLGLGSIFSPEVAQLQGVISSGLQLAFLSFGREDEREADILGLRYVTRTGYDPLEMPGVFRMLARASGGSGSRTPEWLSTHPDPENREAAIRQQIAELPGGLDASTVNREEFLRQIDGIVFGQDPRQGYFVESTFVHPELRFRWDVPEGWPRANEPDRVVAQDPDGAAALSLRAAEGTQADEAARAFGAPEAIVVLDRQRSEVNGLQAVWIRFQAEGGQVPLAGTAAFIEYGGAVYEIMGFAAENVFGRYQGILEGALDSFDAVRDPALLSVEPRRVELVRISRAMTLREFDEQYPSSLSLQALAVLNQVEAGESLQPGSWVKRVTGELPHQTLR